MSKMERFWRWLAWLLPRELVKWATVRCASHATQGKWGLECITSVNALECIKRWDEQA